MCSSDLGVNGYEFPSLYGSLHWTRQFFEVTNAGADVYGGVSRFGFSIKPIGNPAQPSVARFDANYTDVDLTKLSDFYGFAGARFAGRASGRNVLEWPLGHFGQHRGDGAMVVSAPAGADLMTPAFDRARLAERNRLHPEWGPFAPSPLSTHLPVAGDVTYRYDGDQVQVESGSLATPGTHVSFSGRTAWGSDSAFHFHVASRDWQESDEFLAGILTDFGSRTSPVAFGGAGEFDGQMTGAIKKPRVEGRFSGQDLRAWDTTWGKGDAHIVVENSYVTIDNGLITKDGSEIRAEGQFSLGYPRADHGEEINARFHVTDRDLDSLRHAFGLDDWPVSGKLSGEFHLTGQYEKPQGFGAMTIAHGVAYREPFENGTASLRFEGEGVRLDAVRITKATGAITGAA